MATIIVDKNGLGDFTTISAAVAAATTNDVITVNDGVYTEDVVIDKAVTLLSENGRWDELTQTGVKIVGVNPGGALGTVTFTAGSNGSVLGGTGKGFTIIGKDSALGSEASAVYLQGSLSNITIRDNDVVANGDGALTSEYGMTVSNIVIDGNTFSGQTFNGDTPASGDQWTVPNVPRQLVVMGGVATSNITFTNNELTGTAGGITLSGAEQGNTLVTLDVTNSLIEGNVFTGFTNGGAYALRVRRDGTTIANNTFDASESGSDNTYAVLVQTANPGTFTGNDFVATDGSNLIFADPGSDTHTGTSGVDTFSFAPVGTGGAYADLDSGVAFSGQTGFDSLSDIENLAGTSGSDVFFGDEGDNTFFASGGTDTVDGRGQDVFGDTFDATSYSTDVTIDLDAGTAILSNGTTELTNIENATGGSGDDTLIGDEGTNILSGNAGDDTFQGNGGIDVIDGGAGFDTVIFTGNYDDYDITWAGGIATVTAKGADADDALIVDAGLIKFADKALYLVDALSDEFSTVQSAVDAAADQPLDSIIMLAAGDYTEQVVVDGIDNLTIISAPSFGCTDVTIGAPADVTNYGTTSGGRPANAVITVINSANVVIEGITVDGNAAAGSVDGSNAQFFGVFYRNASGEMIDVDVTGVRDAYDVGTTEDGNPVVSGIQRGVAVYVDNTGPQLSFKMTGGTISDFQKNATVFNNTILEVTGVTVIGGGAQPIIAQNGFQVSNSTGTISGNTIEGIGYAGAQVVYSASIMAYGNTGLDITDNIIVGANNESLDAKVVGVYVLDFGTPNSDVTVTGNDISFVDTGIALSGGVTPDTVVVENNTITDLDTADAYAAGVDFYPNATVTVAFDIEGSSQDDDLYGAAGNDTLTGLDGDDTLNGRDGDDILIGGAGDDLIIGGDGLDTAVLGVSISGVFNNDTDPYTAGVQSGWATYTGEGIDVYQGVEIVQGTNGRVLLVGNGGFASIAEALLVATTSGDTILVASGHIEPGPITITTANNGVKLLSVDGTAVINGDGVSQGSAVRIEAGVQQFQLGAENAGFVINAAEGDLAAVYLVSENYFVQVTGNIIDGADGHAVLTGGAMYGGGVLNNELSADGPAAVVYVNGEASLGAANTSFGFSIIGNQITGGDDAGLLVGVESANASVLNNTFLGEASYAQLEVFGTGASITGNTFGAEGPKAIIDAGNAGTDPALIAGQTSFEPGAVWVENPGGEGNVIYTSIQAAIDAAAPGATIHIGEGVFTENLVINKQVHLVGAAGAVLEGALIDLVDGYDGLDEYFEANHPAYSASVGIDLQNSADGSSITGLTIRGFSEGIALGSVTGVVIEDNDFVNNVTGIRKGTAAQVSDLDIIGNSFSHGIHGMTVYGNDTGTFDGVTMNDNTFSAMSEKGIYLEQISNATFEGNSFDDVGNYGRISPPFGSTDGEFGQAIDINLKSKNYSNVTFTDTTITNSGYSNKNGDADYGDFGAAIGVKIRDDGTVYGADPATFTGSIVFDGLEIDGTSTGVRVGEPGKSNDGPNVTLTDVTIENAMVTDVENATDANPLLGGTTVVEFSATQEDLDASASQADVDVVGNDLKNEVTTGSGDDSFDGGLDDDTFDGGDGIDTAIISGVTSVASNGDQWTVVSADGNDILIDVEIIDGGGAKTLLVGAGGFDTIAEALAAANDGDTIMLADDTFSETVNITKGVTIVGAAGGASVVTGAWTINTTAQVTIDGLTFLDDKPVVLNINDNFVALKVLQHSTDGHVIKNSTFERDPSSYPVGFNPIAFAGSNQQQTHRAIEIASVGAGKTISIIDNDFTGENAYPYAGDSWRSGIYSNGGLGTTLIDGNTFTNLRSAINADNFTTTVTITDNNFVAAGSAISMGGAGAVGTDLSTINTNTYGTVGTEFNFQGVPGGVVFDASEAISGAVGDGGVVIYGSTTGGDDITGTDYADQVIGGGGNDTIDTGEGADGINGGAGIDTINAGDGADTILGGADADIMDGGDGDDLFLLNSSSEFATGETIEGGDGYDTILWDAQSYQTLILTDDVTGIEQVEMLGSSDSILGAIYVENSLDIIGNAGDNTIVGTDFADTIDGRDGVDTVEYYDGETITNDGSTWMVGGDELTNVEIVQVNGARTLLVGDTGFEDIADALAVAVAGDTILVSAGIYDPFTVGVEGVTIQAYGTDEVIIRGPLTLPTAAPGPYADMFDYAARGPGVGLTGSTAITVAADGVSLVGLQVEGANIGIGFSGALEDISITGVYLTDVVTGIYKLGTGASIDGLTITDVTIEDAYQGISIEKGSLAGGDVTDLTIDGLTINHVAGKGIYVETLKGDTSISDLIFDDVGQFGRGASFGAPLGGWGAGIDINLKFGTYDGEVIIEDFTFTNVGLSDGGPAPEPHLGGAAIAIKGRDDGASYGGANAAIVTDLDVTVQNGTINGTSTGIRAGEPGKPDSASNVTGPAVTIIGVVIGGAAVSEIDNVSKSLMTVNAGTADDMADVYEAGDDDTATGPIKFLGNADDNTFTGGRGNDQFFGDAGADTLSGGAGDDMFTYTSMAELADDTLDGGLGHDRVIFDTISETSIVLGADTFGMEQAELGGVAVSLDARAVASGLTLFGNSLANTIYGTKGHDTILGGVGNDTIHYASGHGSDLVLGGNDIDALVVSTTGADVAGGATVGVTSVGAGQFAVALSGAASGEVSTIDVENLTINLGSNGVNTVNLVGDLSAITSLTVNGGDTRTALRAELMTSNTSIIANFGDGDDTYYFGSSSANDVLDGGDGFDTLNFAAVDHGVIVDLAKTGTSGVQATIRNVGSDKAINFEAIRGSAFFDVLRGNGLDNTFFASAGGDTINGQGGVDTYDAKTILDGVEVNLADGYVFGDTVGFGQILNVENVTGSRGDDFIIGDEQNNYIDGYLGSDEMYGGDGDDTYVVNTGGDVVVEYANEGLQDTVMSSTHYTLGDNLENLVLTGTLDRNATGNAVANIITGNSGKNIIDGGAGNDIMSGGLGDDTYIANSGGDQVIELAGEGTDTVYSSLNYHLGANIENLVITGSSNRFANGNELNNTITGNTGNNAINGKGGVDLLFGGAGADTFIFSSAAEAGIGLGSRDIIGDFTHDDLINFSAMSPLHFVGTGAFDGAGSVRYLHNDVANPADDYTLVQVDLDGDNNTDFEVQLTGIHTLLADDFLL